MLVQVEWVALYPLTLNSLANVIYRCYSLQQSNVGESNNFSPTKNISWKITWQIRDHNYAN